MTTLVILPAVTDWGGALAMCIGSLIGCALLPLLFKAVDRFMRD